MKKLLLALTFILFAQSAWAQGNPTCPTRPFGDNSNACASTAFVQAAVIGACTAVGAFEVGTGASSQCTNVAGSMAHIGNVADTYDILLAGNAAAGTILQLQDGRTTRVLTSGMAGIGMQSLIDTAAAGFTYSGISLDTQCSAGTEGGCVGINLSTQVTGTWTGVSALSGVSSINTLAKSSRGATVWGSNFVSWCLTIACNGVFSTELDVQNQIAGTAEATGIWLVAKNSVAPTLGYGLHLSSTVSNTSFDTAIRLDSAAGFFPIRTSGSLLTSSTGTITSGFDLSALTMSSGRWVITLNNHKLTSYNAAGSVVQDLLYLDASNALQLYNKLVSVASTGQVTINQNASSSPSTASAAAGLILNLVDNGAGGHQAFSYGAQANNVVARANGTGAAPTKVLNTNNIGAYFFGGFFGTTNLWLTNTAGIRGNAAEDWNDSTHLGTHLQFLTTPTATGANAEAGRFNASGGLSVGTTTDAGIGNVLALNNFTVGTATKTLVLKQGANGTVGTFTCSGAGTITISNTNVAITDTIIISMQSAGGTITTPPAFKTLTAATGFTVLCGATDTSVYNYGILKNAAWLLVPANDNLLSSLAA